MDYESIKRYGLDHLGFDLTNSYETFDQSSNNHTIVLHLIKSENYGCPHCGSHNITIKGSKSQKMKFASALENNITIVLYRRILTCLNCGSYFKEINPFTDSQRTTTIQKDCKILEALRHINNTYTSAAEEFNVSVTYVTNLFDKKVDLKRLNLPLVLSVDEVYSKRLSYHKYCFIMFDPFHHKIIDVIDSRHQDRLESYFNKIDIKERMEVKYFSIDLYDTYRIIGKKFFPNALICADSFHVIKNLSQFFHQIRKSIMNKYRHLKHQNDNYYWLFKRYNKLLTKDRCKLSHKRFKVNKHQYMSQYEIVDYMLSIDPTLKSAYEFLHEYRTFNDTATINNAAEWLDELILKFKVSHIQEYIQAWKLLENWRNEIINSFNTVNGHRISNGPMERVNSDIKILYRLSFGSRNFPRMRNRIMYVINDNSPILYRRKTTTNQYKGKKKGKYNKTK